MYKNKILFSFSRPLTALFNCSFISDVRTSLKQNTETVLGLFQPHYSHVEKYANEAETVSVFYISFISRCATGLSLKVAQKAVWSNLARTFPR